MENDKIVLYIEERIKDLNYLVNSDKTSEKLNFAWRYARGELELILIILNKK